MPLPVRRYILYADGACLGNPGPGGWGVVVAEPAGEYRELSGGPYPATTNNKMEITAAVEGLRVAGLAGEVAQRKMVAARIGNEVLNELKVTGKLTTSQRGSVRFSSISDCVLTIASSSIATMARSHRWLRWRSSRLAIPTSRFTISVTSIGRTIRPIRWNPSALALEAGGSRPTPLNSLGWRHGPSGSQSFCSRRR